VERNKGSVTSATWSKIEIEGLAEQLIDCHSPRNPQRATGYAPRRGYGIVGLAYREANSKRAGGCDARPHNYHRCVCCPVHVTNWDV